MPNTDSDPKSNLAELLQGLASQPHADPELVARMSSLREIIEPVRDVGSPFLTVLLRTQGKRIEPFKDALLCLVGQTDQDFEVIVLAHDVAAENIEVVREIVSGQSEQFLSRLHLIEVSGGTRAKPLNAGLAAARGHFVSIYDDDDLLFANWVEEFHTASQTSNGRALRAIVANQSVTPEIWPGGESGFRTLSWPKVEFSTKFDEVAHFLLNGSPFMSWAFPRTLFTIFGFRFDEDLVVCEDWDVILRASALFGVMEIDQLTSIYRRWQDGESSYTTHSDVAWGESEARVIARNDATVLLLPPGSMTEMRRLALRDDAWKRYGFLFNGNQFREPLDTMWVAVSPVVRVLVRGAKKIRRTVRK